MRSPLMLVNPVMLRPGYAVEYDFIQPTELARTLDGWRDELVADTDAADADD